MALCSLLSRHDLLHHLEISASEFIAFIEFHIRFFLIISLIPVKDATQQIDPANIKKKSRRRPEIKSSHISFSFVLFLFSLSLSPPPSRRRQNDPSRECVCVYGVLSNFVPRDFRNTQEQHSGISLSVIDLPENIMWEMGRVFLTLSIFFVFSKI